MVSASNCAVGIPKEETLARVRAERKCGELLRDIGKAKEGAKDHKKNASGRAVRPLEEEKTLAEMGVSKDQSSKWQKLAEILEEEFEAAVNQPGYSNSITERSPSLPENSSTNAKLLILSESKII